MSKNTFYVIITSFFFTFSHCFREIYYKKPVISDSQNNPKEEEKSQTDQPIHYQNVLFNGNILFL